jgi:hypothetical protein
MGMMRKAQRRKAKLRLGLSGPAGSGKTMGALLVGYGITGDWDKICLIDTENYSGDLYANYSKDGILIGEYNIISLSAPYAPDKYITAIKECEAAGIECIIIDSLTHAWSGEGGLLDKKGQIEKSNKPGINSWTAWRDVTPMHNRLVEAILSSKCHITCTLRAKMEHVQEKDPVSGKNVVRKIGMNPIQRDGMEYEFTTFVDIDQDHQCTSTKDRTSIVDGKVFRLTVDMGKQLLEWLESGTEPLANKADVVKFFARAKEFNVENGELKQLCKDAIGAKGSDQWTVSDLDKLNVQLAEVVRTKMKQNTEKAV